MNLLAKFGFNTAEKEPECGYGISLLFVSLIFGPTYPWRAWAPCPFPLRPRCACGTRCCLSWKVRYRTLLWCFIQMSKLYEARSLLYRRQIFQENIRWKALDEIYKIYMLLHRSDLNISETFCQTFSHFWQKFAKNRYFWILFTDFCSDFDEIWSEFHELLRNSKSSRN